MVNAKFAIAVIALVIIVNLAQAGLVHLVAYICRKAKAKKNKKYTNYDRFKTMTMEQIADLLWESPFTAETYEDVLEWLSSEVEK